MVMQISESLVKNPVLIVPLEKRASLLVFDFLQTGTLRSNSISNKITTVLEKVIVDETFAITLQQLFKKDIKMLLRWVFSIPEFFKNKTVSFFKESFQEFSFSGIILKNQKHFNTDQHRSMNSFFNEKNQKKQWDELIRWAIILHNEGIDKASLFHFLNDSFEKYWGISQNGMSTIIAIAHQNCVLEKGTISSEIVNFLNSWHNQIKKGTDYFKEPERKEISEVENQNKREVDMSFLGEDFLYIKNAGLILLHPFLSMLFEQLNLTVNQEWASQMAQQKGALLTHYLVYGDTEVDESELVLNKILCGLEITEIVNTQIVLENYEKEKCQSLLDAVLEHWKVMKNSSKEALQETFLQREGKLVFQINEYEMWIEVKGYDILLEQLPWGIGMIKTPWMENYLNCHWG